MLPLPRTEKMEFVELAVVMLKMFAEVPKVEVADTNEAEPVTESDCPTVSASRN